MKLIVANTEVNNFGKQLLAFYLERHAIGASTHKGTENKLNRVRDYAAPTRVLVHGNEGEIHALGILSKEKAKEVLRTAILEESWDEEEVPSGANIPLRIVYRTLDDFHQFTVPIKLTDLGWTPEFKPINRTFNEIPIGQTADDIWKKAVKLALEEKTAAWLS